MILRKVYQHLESIRQCVHEDSTHFHWWYKIKLQDGYNFIQHFLLCTFTNHEKTRKGASQNIPLILTLIPYLNNLNDSHKGHIIYFRVSDILWNLCTHYNFAKERVHDVSLDSWKVYIPKMFMNYCHKSLLSPMLIAKLSWIPTKKVKRNMCPFRSQASSSGQLGNPYAEQTEKSWSHSVGKKAILFSGICLFSL